MPNYAAILASAKRGDLTKEDLDEVLGEFRHGVRSHPERYRLVLTVGHATLRDASGPTDRVGLGSEKARALIEPLLDSVDDPWLIREALTVLCYYLGDASRYRDRLRALVHPAAWDEAGDVRTVAISCLGQLIAKEGTRVGLDDLLQIAEDSTDPKSDWAVRAIAEALGHGPQTLPTVRKGMRSNPALVRSVLERAKAWRNQGQRPPREQPGG